MKLLPRLALALAGLASPLHAATPEDQAIRQAAHKTLPEFVEYLRMPNIMRVSTADMRKNADWTEAAFKRHGFEARQLADGETPWVFAQSPNPSKAKKTVLFYAHMDGQAVFPKEWDQPDPFTPTLKQKGADGKLTAIPIERLSEANPDPEWRLFARSAADDKAPVMMLMAAMDALKATGKAPAINIKIIIDPHEEGGPPTFKDVIARNLDLMKADAVVMLDGPMHASNKPTIVFGNRGGGGFGLTVFGARGELHSGHYGNYSPNPVFGLARILGAMKDIDGRVLIPGYYEGINFSPEFKKVLAAVPDDAAAVRARLGIAQEDKVGANYQEAMNYTTLNVTAIKAGEYDSGRSIIPSWASARVEFRTVPGSDPKYLLGLFRKFIEDQGYHVIAGTTPTEEERRTYPRLAAMIGGRGMEATATPLDSSAGVWARAAFQRSWKEEPVRIPIMGGGVPSGPLVEGLKVPLILIPLVNADNNQHASNENLRIGNYYMGVQSLYSLYTQPLTGQPVTGR